MFYYFLESNREKITVTFFSHFFIYDIWNVFNRDFQTQINSGRYYYTGLQTEIN